MKAQILKMEERQGVGKTSGKPYNAFFVRIIFQDPSGKLDCDRIFVDKAACPTALPDDTMVEVVTAFRSTRVERLEILPHEQPFVLRG